MTDDQGYGDPGAVDYFADNGYGGPVKPMQHPSGEHYKGVTGKLGVAAAGVGKARTIEQAREAMKELSKPMAMWASMSKPAGIDVVFCSMAKGSWLQRDDKIRNPYYGAKMLKCGEIVSGKHKGQSGGHMKHHH